MSRDLAKHQWHSPTKLNRKIGAGSTHLFVSRTRILRLVKASTDTGRAVVCNYISRDVENLCRRGRGIALSVVAYFDMLSYDLSSRQSAVSVKAEELKGSRVYAG